MLHTLRLLLISALLAASWTLAAQHACAQLPSNGKLKVYILAGQSNMEGYGKVDLGRDPANPYQTNGSATSIIGGLGSLRNMVNKDPAKYGYLVDPANTITYPSYTGSTTYPGWRTRSDVWVSYWDESSPGVTVQRRNGALGVGFGAQNGMPEGYIGPEYGFGQIVGNATNDQVLFIKTAWGGKSLEHDFRPPSSGSTGAYYTEMIAKVHQVLNNLPTYYPGYGNQGYEIAGFGWHQGWNDRIDPEHVAHYETNLANLIKDVRTEFNVPKMPFVIGNTGMAVGTDTNALNLIKAQGNVADPTLHPEFAGTVATVDTRPFDYGELQSPSQFGYHWYHNGESQFHVGESMGQAMVNLQLQAVPEPSTIALLLTAAAGFLACAWRKRK